MMKMKKILALDPGVKHTGWCDGLGLGTVNAETLSEMKGKLARMIKAERPGLLAVEDFRYEPWRRRIIDQGAEMGKLIGYLEALAEGWGIEFAAFTAKKTKANMYWVRRNYRNEHEFSAFCVFNFAVGWLRKETAVDGLR